MLDVSGSGRKETRNMRNNELAMRIDILKFLSTFHLLGKMLATVEVTLCCRCDGSHFVLSVCTKKIGFVNDRMS